jgi:NmrA-like family
VTWVKTSYQGLKELTEILKDVHTVLSFVVTQSDPGNVSQKNLIDAAIRAGVKRFAPSEWAT